MKSNLPAVNVARLHGAMDAPPDLAALSRTLEAAEIMPSYIAYLPSRMGFSRALDAAADCVFAAAACVATLNVTERAQLGLLRKYGRALTLLREAIMDPVESMSAEVLGAVSLLSVYEVLSHYISLAGVSWPSISRIAVSPVIPAHCLDQPPARHLPAH
jgi:hypothetical protein